MNVASFKRKYSKLRMLMKLWFPLIIFYKKLNSSRCKTFLDKSDFRFFIKFTEPYIAKFLSPRQKLMIQCNHYGFLNRIFCSNDFFQNIKKGIVIWVQEYDTCEDKQSIVLRISDLSKYEGEMVLEYLFNNTQLHFVTFSFAPGTIIDLANEQLILIGGSQGRYNDLKLIRDASKLNGEINPSAALILALKAISRVIGIKIMLGIKASQQISRNINPDIGYFSYDYLWIKNYGEEYSEYYAMPTNALRKISDPVEGTHKSRTRKKRVRKEEMISEIMSGFEKYIFSTASQA